MSIGIMIIAAQKIEKQANSMKNPRSKFTPNPSVPSEKYTPPQLRFYARGIYLYSNSPNGKRGGVDSTFRSLCPELAKWAGIK